MPSDNEKREVLVHISSSVDGEMQQFEYDGTLQESSGKYLLKYTDEQGVSTSLKFGEDVVHLIRSGSHVDHRFCIKSGEKTTGVMGQTPFSVVGKRSEWLYNDTNGEIRLCYLLPDLSERPMSFNIRIKFIVK